MNPKALIIVLLVLISCSEPEPRKPITHNSSVSFYEESIQLNRNILNKEMDAFKNIIQKDTLNSYISSPYGFWYFYNKQVDTNSKKAKKGDIVIINYTIKDLDNNILISKNELGSKGQESKSDRLLKIDGEDFILGLHEGIKLMREGDVVTFLLPSSKAFGSTGLHNIIAPNQPLILKVKLKTITNNN